MVTRCEWPRVVPLPIVYIPSYKILSNKPYPPLFSGMSRVLRPYFAIGKQEKAALENPITPVSIMWFMKLHAGAFG